MVALSKLTLAVCCSNMVADSDGFLLDALRYEEDGEIFDVMDM